MNQLIVIAANLLTNKKIKKIVIGIVIGTFLFLCIIGYLLTNLPWLIIGYYNNTQVQVNLSQQQFLEKVAADAANSYTKYKVFTSIVLAQAILESSWGESKLALYYNNLYGIKAEPGYIGKTTAMKTSEEFNGKQISIIGIFRAYDSWEDSTRDHIRFLMDNLRYTQSGVFEAKTYEEQAHALQKADYATDSKYAELLISLVKMYNLQKYDLEASHCDIKFAFPSPFAQNITSGFGIRKSPIQGASIYHTGIDLSGNSCFNTPVIATLDGIVETIWYNDYNFGNAVLLKHKVNNTTWYTKYGHLNSISVILSQQVLKGQQIGLIGNTGKSTGSHLHFEVQPNGNPVDPTQYIF